jgi:hypothetical protein
MTTLRKRGDTITMFKSQEDQKEVQLLVSQLATLNEHDSLSIENIRLALLDCQNDDRSIRVAVEKLPSIEQLIVVLFYIKDNSYFFDGESDRYIKIECNVFVNGKREEFLLVHDIESTNGPSFVLEIDNISCESYKGYGIGSCILRTLTIVATEIGANKIIAKLSKNDYESKDLLYNFYITKNDFQVSKELTKQHCGWVKKHLGLDAKNSEPDSQEASFERTSCPIEYYNPS